MELGAGDVTLRALYSGLSRGTERLVSEGRVPFSEFARMRCPHQEGDFPFPVKYGYTLVAQLESGPPGMVGRPVFLLHPHQSALRASITDIHFLPDGLTARRAVLTANMETALNVVWDAGVGPGDKVLVIGGGVLGLLIAALSARIAGVEVTVSDLNPAREHPARGLGAGFALPAKAPKDQDVVIHTSASEAGLALALDRAGTEARIVEASWFGDKPVTIPLGEGFHAKRLKIISSQVGMVSPERRVRWTYARRLAMAMNLLRDAAFDTLITGEIAFTEAASLVPQALADNTGLMTLLRYS